MTGTQVSATGFEALYWTEADFLASKPPRKRPIVGWDENGDALTVTPAGKRIPAASFSDFHSVRQVPHIVAALPGGEWRLTWRMLPVSDQAIGEPVISWVVYSDGDVRPVANVIGGGHLQPLDLTEGDIELIPPARDEASTCLRCGTQCSDPFSPDFVATMGCGGAAN